MIYFPTNNLLPNYREFPSLYNHYSLLKGKDVYSSYIYWILKNNCIQNIKLVDKIDTTKKNDIIFFHFDNLKCFNFNSRAKKVQFVSDRPLVNGCQLYLTSDHTVCSDYNKKNFLPYVEPSILSKSYLVEMTFFPEPLPVGLRKCKVNYPPKKAVCMGLYDNVDRELLQLIEEKNMFFSTFKITKKIKNINFIKNIKFELYNECNNNKGDEDIFFFIRNKESGYNYAGYKHPNRLFISFYCNVPGFYYGEKVICANRKSEYDFIEVSSTSEFIYKLDNYISNENLFLNILKQIKSREDENNEQLVVKTFNKIIQQLKNY